MNLKLKLNNLICSALLIIFSAVASAQTGSIHGKISDEGTSEALVAVTIKFLPSNKKGSSDINGEFTVNELKTGKYTVEFSYLGYETKKITDVIVSQGKITDLSIVLKEKHGTQLGEVVVTGSYKKETVNALYLSQKNNAVISDGLSSDLIKRTPDKNTSDVLKRISGANIQDNKFVIIRGLSDRYNTAMLDHASLPSTEPNRKAFSFDIVPSNLVDNITVSKTATPDLPGDFTGGAVQILTIDVPNKNFLTFNIGTGINTVSTFKSFLTGPRAASEYFAVDHNGSRALAPNFPSTNQITGGLAPQKNIDVIKSFPQDWNIYNHKALPTQNYQLSIGQVKRLKNNAKIGMILSGTYRNNQSVTPNLIRDYHVYDYTDNSYKFSTNLGAIANFGYTYKKSKITFKNLYNRVFDDNYLYRSGTNVASSSAIKFYTFDLLVKSLFKSTVEGEHQIGAKNAKINWNLSYSKVINDQPDQRKVNYTRNLGDENAPYAASVTTLGKENTRLYSYLNENGYSGSVSYNLPIKMFHNSGTFKTGINSLYRDRSFDVRFFGLLLDPNTADFNQIRQRPLNTLFSKDLIESNAYKLDELSNAGDIYSANSITNAGYAMLDNKIGKKSRVVWGLRAEQFSLNLNTNSSLITPVNLNTFSLLPSINYTYSINSKTNFRASYYRTTARPEFRELAPFAYYDYDLLSMQSGNTKLKSAMINNFDLRYEIYPKSGQIISVSAFYKQFNNAIESYIDDVNSTPTISYFNSQHANTYGIEFEIRKSLEFINSSDFFKNTTFYTNLSLIKSVVTNPNNPLTLEKTRPMVGQAPYIINGGLSHSFIDNKINVNLLYNRVGRKIFKAGGQQFPSVWENPRDVVDLQVSYRFLKDKKAEFKLNAGDILGQKYILYFDKDHSGTYNPVANNKNPDKFDQTISSFKPGSNYSFSFSYTF